ncbi:MAG TPA: GDSL-type esterase/lipase family protein [Dehalococcoidia bacterium]
MDSRTSFSFSFRALAALLVAALALTLLVAACGGGSSDSTALTSDVTTATGSPTPTAPTPPPSPAPTPTLVPVTSGPTSEPTFPHITPSPEPTPINPLGDQKLYLALGDSLSAGNGASDPSRTSFVALITQALGASYEVLDLGVPGHTSDDLINKQLSRAVSEIQARNTDGIPGNETAAITLEIGGNDLLNLYTSLVLPGTCPSVPEALQRPQCVDGLRNALDHYRTNLEQILDALKAADPNVPIFLETLYNPFSGGANNLDQIGALALEGQAGTVFPDGLNDVIRQVGQEKGVTVVDWYPIFVGKSNQYISQDLIHPNDTGYQLMAQAILDAMAQAGLP